MERTTAAVMSRPCAALARAGDSRSVSRTVKEIEPSGVKRPKARDMKSACISVPFDPPSVFGGGGGGGGDVHGSGTHSTSHRHVFEPSAWKAHPMNHASATSLSERNMRMVKTPDSTTVTTAKSRARQLLGARMAIISRGEGLGGGGDGDGGDGLGGGGEGLGDGREGRRPRGMAQPRSSVRARSRGS